MEAHEAQRDTGPTESCFDKSCSALTLDDVYEIAKLIGAEVERLIDGYGKESVLGLVPRIVKVLELLESFASRNLSHKLKEEELLKTFEAIQLQQQQLQQHRKRGGGKDNSSEEDRHETRVRHGHVAVRSSLQSGNTVPATLC